MNHIYYSVITCVGIILVFMGLTFATMTLQDNVAFPVGGITLGFIGALITFYSEYSRLMMIYKESKNEPK